MEAKFQVSRCFLTKLRVGRCSLPALALDMPSALDAITVDVVGGYTDLTTGLPVFQPCLCLSTCVSLHTWLEIPVPHL